MLDKITEILLHGEGVMNGSVLLGVGLLIAVVLHLLVAPGHRSRLRTPMVLLLAGAGLMLGLDWLPLRPRLHGWISVAPVALLLLAFGRLVSIAIFDWLLTRRLQTDAPRIVRDIFDILFTGLALLITLGAFGVEPSSLLTTSAVVTAVLGLSLQDTLGNLFAGLALQFQRPFDVGDWIQIDREGMQIGQVLEINWRATRLTTGDSQELTVPNSLLARSVILNHSRFDLVNRGVKVTLPYELPTQRAQEVLLGAAQEVDGILKQPPPKVLTQAFADLGVTYDLRFYIGDFSRRNSIEAAVRDRIWYVLQRSSVPFSTAPRGVSVPSEPTPQSDQATRAAAIRKVDFLRGLPDQAIDTLVSGSNTELYAPGEMVVRQGETGEELYLCMRGELQVLHQVDSGEQHEVARLQAGGLFGEIAQLTGQARNASVRAATACELLVVGKQAFVQVLTDNPALAEQISERLAERQAEVDALERVTPELKQANLDNHKMQFLKRIREFFLS
jgi:small-conductance mechanosensitive channel/CRP-like cAMP-binding protein